MAITPLEFPLYEEFEKCSPLSIEDYTFYFGTRITTENGYEAYPAFWVSGGRLSSLRGVAFQLTEDNYEMVKQAIEADRMARINALIG